MEEGKDRGRERRRKGETEAGMDGSTAHDCTLQYLVCGVNYYCSRLRSSPRLSPVIDEKKKGVRLSYFNVDKEER